LGLASEQIESAITDENTKLPDYLKMESKQDAQEDEGGE